VQRFAMRPLECQDHKKGAARERRYHETGRKDVS
jgi:hypothetical protein